jgi:hypothetical protein
MPGTFGALCDGHTRAWKDFFTLDSHDSLLLGVMVLVNFAQISVW